MRVAGGVFGLFLLVFGVVMFFSDTPDTADAPIVGIVSFGIACLAWAFGGQRLLRMVAPDYAEESSEEPSSKTRLAEIAMKPRWLPYLILWFLGLGGWLIAIFSYLVLSLADISFAESLFVRLLALAISGVLAGMLAAELRAKRGWIAVFGGQALGVVFVAFDNSWALSILPVSAASAFLGDRLGTAWAARRRSRA